MHTYHIIAYQSYPFFCRYILWKTLSFSGESINIFHIFPLVICQPLGPQVEPVKDENVLTDGRKNERMSTLKMDHFTREFHV